MKISVAPHPDFHRSGNDIEAPLPLKISEALLGTTKEVNTMDGTKVVKIPPGVKPGTKIRLKSLGFPNPASKGTRGDFFCVVEYKLPQALSDQQKEIVEQLQALDL